MKYVLAILFLISANGLMAQTMNPDFKLMLDSIYDQQVARVSVEEFIEMNKNDVYALDTRENEEYNISHLKNARNAGYFWFDMRSVYDIPLDAHIVVYCSIGTRSEKIAQKLMNAGYKNVYNLYGGIFEWINSGQPVYNQKGVQTSEIHTYIKDWEKWVVKGTKRN